MKARLLLAPLAVLVLGAFAPTVSASNGHDNDHHDCGHHYGDPDHIDEEPCADPTTTTVTTTIPPTSSTVSVPTSTAPNPSTTSSPTTDQGPTTTIPTTKLVVIPTGTTTPMSISTPTTSGNGTTPTSGTTNVPVKNLAPQTTTDLPVTGASSTTIWYLGAVALVSGWVAVIVSRRKKVGKK